jgi:hypothetical protein
MLSPDQLDAVLTCQLAVAWAGESGDDEPRLRWWETDMISRYGGLALLDQLAPRTARWAAFEAAREAARRVDDEARSRDADPDRLLSLFRFGFGVDEQLHDRLLEHKRRAAPIDAALPELAALVQQWDRDRFAAWAKDGGERPNIVRDPGGRRLTGAPPADAVQLARRLTHALLPLAEAYPFPHYRDA